MLDKHIYVFGIGDMQHVQYIVQGNIVNIQYKYELYKRKVTDTKATTIYRKQKNYNIILTS